MINFNLLKNKIPLPIRLFLGKALLLFIAWEIIYSVFLFDSQFLDGPLTTHIGESSAQFLNNFTSMDGFVAKNESWTTTYEGELLEEKVSAIYHYDNKVLNIANVCNGLSLLALYVGFIICMPSKFWRKILYIILGLIILDVINILRCVGLIYLREYFYVYFEFAHHYLFKATVYTATFLIWMLYCRKIHFKNESLQVG
ncbi:archaeosortase/exosortase family protein [Flavivirga amylovorans]|uniref:Archaeosortase/exosortase family protein n=1 Tax=Flavivirga amylovorans TaxID=870486 RepID=A0ABT8X6Q5_9FLAO|nr:archaeosortase/exosortase family protein [Flavivirga amylovorans]MDO5989517.1 archaeosortase/exosortase family protein [Flavivirga amylovorans]